MEGVGGGDKWGGGLASGALTTVLSYCPFDISRKDVFCLAFYLK